MSDYQPQGSTYGGSSALGGTESTSRGALESEDGRSIGQILGDVTRDVSTLMRQEVALARAEVTQSATRAGKAIGLFAGAGIAGILFLVFVSLSAAVGLGQFIGAGSHSSGVQWGSLIVAIVWAIVAAILAVLGRNELRRIRGLPRTQETLSKVPNALKGQEEENR